MTEIAQFNTIEEAMIAKGMLASHGIQAKVESNTLNNIFPGAGSYGASLYVDSSKADEASQLLSSHGDI